MITEDEIKKMRETISLLKLENEKLKIINIKQEKVIMEIHKTLGACAYL